VKNYHSGGGDPEERMLCHEEWMERRKAREDCRIEGGVVMIRLPLGKLIELSERLERLGTLKERLMAVAEAL